MSIFKRQAAPFRQIFRSGYHSKIPRHMESSKPAAPKRMYVINMMLNAGLNCASERHIIHFLDLGLMNSSQPRRGCIEFGRAASI